MLNLCFSHTGEFWLSMLSLANRLTFKQRSRRGQCLDQRNNFQKILFGETWSLHRVLVESSWTLRSVLKGITSFTYSYVLLWSCLSNVLRGVSFFKSSCLSPATVSSVCSPEDEEFVHEYLPPGSHKEADVLSRDV